MKTDAEIKSKGFNALLAELGSVGMEKFIALIQREPFDYTQWQRDLWDNKTMEDISKNAMHLRQNTKNNNC